MLAAVVVTGVASIGSAPASAAASSGHVLTYGALGDSYAAGQSRNCSHPASSYPLLLDELHRVKLLRDSTCAGATSADVSTNQVPELNRGIGLVTITVGANDLKVADLAMICASNPPSADCRTALLERLAALPSLSLSLRSTFADVAAAAPKARILVTGYAPLLSAGPIYLATQALNATIEDAVLSASASGLNIAYVDVQFTGHTLDSPDPWFTSTGLDPFHPTPAGEQAYADAIAGAL